MPSGRTHDRITLWSLPAVTGIAYGLTLNASLTLLVAGGFLFGGLMFGPDLDIYSRQYQRWGWLRWIWLPYQKSLRHRSFFSHGPLVGTALRLLYLGGWAGLSILLVLSASQIVWGIQWDLQPIADKLARSLRHYQIECLALYIGLELGAMSHSLSDLSGSAYKRLKTRGWSGLLSGSPQSKKRKLPGANSKSSKR